ncbi:MAG: hypothetical protein E5W98_22865 [Mesorhizobium sp.]|nr:MAG: hypothetical protein E5W98_22865 [Mesorhizobium sp.]
MPRENEGQKLRQQEHQVQFVPVSSVGATIRHDRTNRRSKRQIWNAAANSQRIDTTLMHDHQACSRGIDCHAGYAFGTEKLSLQIGEKLDLIACSGNLDPQTARHAVDDMCASLKMHSRSLALMPPGRPFAS